jgi:hypothetical protein
VCLRSYGLCCPLQEQARCHTQGMSGWWWGDPLWLLFVFSTFSNPPFDCSSLCVLIKVDPFSAGSPLIGKGSRGTQWQPHCSSCALCSLAWDLLGGECRAAGLAACPSDASSLLLPGLPTLEVQLSCGPFSGTSGPSCCPVML